MTVETIGEKAARLRVVDALPSGRTYVVGDTGVYDVTEGVCRCTAASYRRTCSHLIAARSRSELEREVVGDTEIGKIVVQRDGGVA